MNSFEKFIKDNPGSVCETDKLELAIAKLFYKAGMRQAAVLAEPDEPTVDFGIADFLREEAESIK